MRALRSIAQKDVCSWESCVANVAYYNKCYVALSAAGSMAHNYKTSTIYSAILKQAHE